LKITSTIAISVVPILLNVGKNMAKKSKMKTPSNSAVDTGRGVINHNALAALVTSKLFKPQVVKAKKGKGSFKRGSKHSGQESYLIAA
jgi:alternative ribosome-rescue factor